MECPGPSSGSNDTLIMEEEEEARSAWADTQNPIAEGSNAEVVVRRQASTELSHAIEALRALQLRRAVKLASNSTDQAGGFVTNTLVKKNFKYRMTCAEMTNDIIPRIQMDFGTQYVRVLDGIDEFLRHRSFIDRFDSKGGLVCIVAKTPRWFAYFKSEKALLGVIVTPLEDARSERQMFLRKCMNGLSRELLVFGPQCSACSTDDCALFTLSCVATVGRVVNERFANLTAAFRTEKVEDLREATSMIGEEIHEQLQSVVNELSEGGVGEQRVKIANAIIDSGIRRSVTPDIDDAARKRQEQDPPEQGHSTDDPRSQSSTREGAAPRGGTPDQRTMNLIDAVRTEPLENIKSIVKSKGIPIDSLWLDYTVLNTALECRRKDVAVYLLENECRVNKFTLTQEAASTPLHNAVFLGDKDLVVELLKRKASISAVDVQGNTPLHLAFMRREEQIIDAIFNLVQETDNYTNLKNSKGLSHLHIACTRKNLQVISGFLKPEDDIDHTVKENCKSWAGYTALHFATKFRSSIAVKLLLKAGANPQAKNVQGQTPIQLANKDLVESSVIVDRLSAGNDNWCHTMSYFHLACLKNDPSTLKAFIDRGINVHTPVHYSSPFCPDYAPLHFAVSGGCEGNVELLLSHKVDNECFNEYYQTPLHLSLYKDNFKITKMLYEDAKHSSENVTDCNGLDYLDVAVARNDVAQVCSYLDKGENVNKRVTYEKQRFYHYTPLHFAVLYQSFDVAKLLIERGADVNASDGARHGTPLHLALKLGHQDLVELLLKNKADARALRPCDQATSIHVLIEGYVRQKANGESLKYVERLVKLGVDVNAKTSSNSTALHISCLFKDVKCAKLLLEFGADVNVTSKCGNTAFDLCVQHDKKPDSDAGDLVEVLYHHVQKLKALGMQVNERNEDCCKKVMKMKEEWYPERFRDEVLKSMEQQRRDEIVKLSKTRFTTHTSFKDFLMLDTKRAAAYLRTSGNLKLVVQSEDLIMREFPNFGYLLKLRYEQAVERMSGKGEVVKKKDVGCQTVKFEAKEVPVKRLRVEK